MIGRIGVCSWSLQSGSPEALADAVASVGASCVQLALDPIREGVWDLEHTRRSLEDRGIVIASGMMACRGEDYSTLESIERTGGIRPDATWRENLNAARTNALITGTLGLPLVTFHAGFMPSDPEHPERPDLVERVFAIGGIFANDGAGVALETGQETAETLIGFLESVNKPDPPLGKRVGVNFDPANMILYGKGDPIEAFRALADRVVQVHIKDAIPADRPGEWGTEVRAGTGAVDWHALAALVRALPQRVDLIIEREAGDDRLGDIAAARAMVGEVFGAASA